MMRKEDDLTDTDILQLIEDFKKWRASHPTDRDGLDQMLALIEKSIVGQTPLCDMILLRSIEGLNLLDPIAAKISVTLQNAVAYIGKNLSNAESNIDADPAFLYCIDFANSASEIYPEAFLKNKFTLEWNGVMHEAGLQRLLAFYAIQQGREPLASTLDALSTPMRVHIRMATFPLPLYIDSMQFGLLAWGSGAEFCMNIWNWISNPDSRGKFCSLYGHSDSKSVTPEAHLWHQRPEFQHWINEGIHKDSRIPVTVTESLVS